MAVHELLICMGNSFKNADRPAPLRRLPETPTSPAARAKKHADRQQRTEQAPPLIAKKPQHHSLAF
jgi:hypothetical protein